MSKKTYKVTGNTIQIKDKIRKAGGKWDAARKCWIVELHPSDSLWRYEGQITIAELGSTKTNKELEKEWDELHNEGGEGFNPYR